MKKEKTVKTYQRRTKSGKVVTVKQHTAKYDAADKAKEMASKKGAGEELAAKKGMPDHNLPMNEYLAELKKMREKPEETPMEQETKKSSPSAEKKSKSVKSTKSTKNAATTQANGVSASDFKSWYHFNDWDKPKKSWPAEVRAADAAIRKQLGSKKAYDDYCAQIDGSYSKSGHNKAFKSFGGGVETSTSSKSPAKMTKGDRAVAKMHKLVNEAFSSTTSDPKVLKKQLGALIDYNGGPVNYGDKIGKRIDEIREQLGKRSSLKKRVEKKSDYDYERSMAALAKFEKEERKIAQSKITSKVGKGYKTMKDPTERISAPIYVSSDGKTAYYEDPTNKGKLKKASDTLLKRLTKDKESATKSKESKSVKAPKNEFTQPRHSIKYKYKGETYYIKRKNVGGLIYKATDVLNSKGEKLSKDEAAVIKAAQQKSAERADKKGDRRSNPGIEQMRLHGWSPTKSVGKSSTKASSTASTTGAGKDWSKATVDKIGREYGGGYTIVGTPNDRLWSSTNFRTKSQALDFIKRKQKESSANK